MGGLQTHTKYSVSYSGTPEKPKGIVFLGEPGSPKRDRLPPPDSWAKLLIDDKEYWGKFVKIALNVVKKKREEGNRVKNELDLILRTWFGIEGISPGGIVCRVTIDPVRGRDDEFMMKPLPPQSADSASSSLVQEDPFNPGQIYLRSDLHDRFGGQRQGGISTPREHPIIMLFSGKSGRRYGYYDEWKGNVFLLTGEGQHGDQRMIKGNRAIRDHGKNRRILHLFESLGRGEVKYFGQMICQGVLEETEHDLGGSTRDIYRFVLVPAQTDGSLTTRIIVDPTEENQLRAKSTDDLRRIAIEASSASIVPEEAVRKVRRGSSAIKLYIKSRANGYCEYCKSEAPFLKKDGSPYVEVHHIESLSDEGPDDPAHVVGLCPNCHREAHYGERSEGMKKDLREIAVSKERH